ncbi:MAG: hypothetical protein D9C04_05325 [Nitrosopumilus sp. B06]|nr:MAG: hypothetical protein EB828_04390 [Nitrosopumilus sp. D6]RNJ79237.1 MAG: hypothetical protein D9C04_05325 [Nitrosopumilus sp. B06]
MVVHSNIHIPSESFPHWIWYAIECVMVLVVSLLASREITDSLEGLAPDVQNYIFMGIVGLLFLVWYIGIRGFVLKKRILQSRY